MRYSANLRTRLGFGAAVLALLAVTAAGLAVYALARTQAEARLAMAAQRRIEAYAAHSARVNDWMLAWLRQESAPPDAAPVLATLDLLDQLIAEDLAQSPPPASDLRPRSGAPGRLRGAFLQLQKTLSLSPPGTPPGEAGIAFYAGQAPQLVLAQIDYETRRRDQALADMEALRRPLLALAIGIALLAPLVLLALYLFVFRPLFTRLSLASRQAAGLLRGEHLAQSSGHDELGLLFARLRLVAQRLERRRAALAAAHDRLEGAVAERTAALTEANARLERTDASRRRFFADVGHELRTPLTVILGEAELGSAHPDPAVRAGFETVRTRALRLFRRIEDLLRIARSETGQLELERAPLHLAEVVAQAQADLSPVLKRAGVTSRLDMSDLRVLGDPDWLRQVFAGLFENAAKYAGRGAEVQVTGARDGAAAVIDITDSGPGLKPGGVDIFDRFARKGDAPGFGVGLALARWVVEASGGRLDQIAAEKGLHLRLVLPLAEEG